MYKSGRSCKTIKVKNTENDVSDVRKNGECGPSKKLEEFCCCARTENGLDNR